jgi:death-on-curing protein
MIIYLTLEDAITQTHELGFYIKDAGLLEAALSRPKTSAFGEDVYPSLELKAASILHSVIRNHPMIDGNKRTAWALFVTFIFINGYVHNMSTDEGFDLTLGVAEGRYELEAAAGIISSHLRPLN